MKKYNPQKVEKKWQREWEKKKAFRASNFSKKKKLYLLVEFPYPSGDGLHVGHCRSFTAFDVMARKKRMEGFNVLYPMGWDAFGLPTENYAIKMGLHPSVITKRNTDTFRRQMKKMGFSFDWSREINTTDPGYYKWTQWIFTQLFKKGLAYKQKSLINWCPSCKTGLANEEVVSGECERCGAKVRKKEKKQWMIKITKYADRLIKDLDKVDYLEKIKTQQKEWIGRSKGALVKFPLKEGGFIEVFTTRIDTIFSGTFLILSPGHELIDKEKIKNREEVLEYREKSRNIPDMERTNEEREITGVELKGIKAINPASNEEIPVWVSDFVLEHYGTGAVFGNAHDKRDFKMAKKYGLPLKTSIKSKEECFEGEGILHNSKQFNGLTSEVARPKIISWLKDFAKEKISYKLRDWVFSRQHYWGEPTPMVNCPKCGWQPVPEKELPVKLPRIRRYQPTDTGESPLSLVKKWVNTNCPKCEGPAKRETDTMPNWAGSNWYFLRYCDPENSKKIASAKRLKYFMPVDWYNGGMEHVTLHLLYSRFIFKFLRDIGAVPKSIGQEPYEKRTAHGMILGEGGIKMSKSKGNVVNPEKAVDKYGADALRVYEMFVGPFEQAASWNTKGLNGVKRFLEKVWRLKEKTVKRGNKNLESLMNKTIKKVGEDIESLKFNTAVSSLMILANEMEKEEEISLKDYSTFLIILSPFAPHISEELWKDCNFKGLCSSSSWPKFDKKVLKKEKIKIIIQINGKVKERLELNPNATEKEIKEEALSNQKIKDIIRGKEIKKTIVVPKRLINFVI